MSFNTTFSNYSELVKYLQTVSEPQCFTVNYLPDTNEYALWIGNQPYYVYEKWIEEEEEENRDLRKEVQQLKAKLYDLTEKRR